MIREMDCAGSDRFMARYKDRYCYGGDDNDTTTTTSNSAPWGPAQPYLTDLMGRAQSLTNQGSSYAPFSTVAPFSDQTLQGLNMTQGIANSGNPNVTAASGALTNLLQASPQAVNPYLDQMYKAASRPVIDSVNAQFGMGGRTGSGYHAGTLTDRLGDMSAQIYGQGYENAANRNMQLGNQKIAAATLAPQLDNARYTGAQNLLSVGNAYDQKAQQYLGDAQNRWDYTQNQPWNLLKNYSGVVSGMGGMGGTATGTSSVPSQSIVPQLLGTGVNLLGMQQSNGNSLFANLLDF